jgi:hypothetical protein
MAVRFSALRTSRTLLPRNTIILMFLVLISVRPERLGKFKNSPPRESNPRPSSFNHYATACPTLKQAEVNIPMVHASPERADTMGGVNRQNSPVMLSIKPLGKFKKARKSWYCIIELQ